MPAPDDETRFMAPVQATALPPRYEMLSELGRGGMGIVYKVRDRETGEVVALKILKPEIAANPQILERFKNELLLAHKITHRHVARLYEFHRAGDAVYLSMEYVEGESLRSLLEREGRLETGRAVEFARQLAAGLAEAHRQSIVHRDLKPENIMIAPDGDLKVMDFGISRSYAEDATMTGSVVGTPAYMAPEQAEGKALDHRVDVYAFGLTLYEMFTGQATFQGDTAVTLALKQIRERPTNPTKLAPSLPRRIDAAIMKCLEKEPAKRFQTVDEAFQALAGVTAPDAPKIAEAGRPRFLLAAIGAVILLAVAGVWWWYSRPSDTVVFPLEKFTLANGLRVALSPDHSSPTFSLAVTYLAGSRRDTAGHAALAYLVQRALYQGSPNVARGEYADLVGASGGTTNGSTNSDATHLVTTLPANQLDLALFLEADRMSGLAITEEGLNAAKSELLEERAGAMGSGYAVARSIFNTMAFSNFANQQTGYGTVEEVNRATLDEVRQFYQTYYAPSNAGLALVGDFDPAKARERIAHYFGSIPAHPVPPATNLREPVRADEKRRAISAPGVPNALIIAAWQVPKGLEPDWFAIKELGEVLGGTGLSRLQNALVKTAGLATTATIGVEGSAGPNLMVVQVLVAPGKDPAQAERMVYEEIDRVAREGVSQEEIERVATDSLRRRTFQLVTTANRAQVFGEFLTIYGRPDAVNEWERQVRRVGNRDVKRVAQKYLTVANRTVLVFTPAGKP